MSNYNHFDYVPSTVDRKRSIFKYKVAHARSGLLGYLYPICKPIRMMPGSSITLDLAADIRSGALIAPLMDEIYCDVFGFFVPNRIVWEHWKQFIGALDDVTFNNRVEYQIPTFKFGAHAWEVGNKNLGYQWNQCIACHFGLPYPLTGVTISEGAESASTNVNYAPSISVLPFRGYTFIWNEYFRPLQILQPLVINKTDTGYAGMNMDITTDVFTGFFLVDPADGYNNRAQTGGAVLPVSRAHRDLWTASLPAPSLETLNLLAGLTAPVGMYPGADGTSTVDIYPNLPAGTTLDDATFIQMNTGNGGVAGAGSKLITDLNQALLTVNNYRETIMLQNYWDVLNRAGSRYDSIIRNIFGVTASSQLVDIPDLIIHKRFTIYRKEVVATAEGTNQPIGTQASYINTVVKDSLLTTSSVEHGYLHLMWAIRPARLRHSSGIEPEWFEIDKFDLYYPQFDGMGDVARYKSELFYTFSDFPSSNRAGILGYQEYGATWKYQRSDAAGYLDPHTPSYIGGYTLCDNYEAQPALNGYFIGCLQEMLAFANCLAISDFMLVPQFVIDFRLNGTITHPMPVYNIPGAGALL